MLDIAYAGSKGTALYEFRNANQALPTADPTISRNSRRPLPYLGGGLVAVVQLRQFHVPFAASQGREAFLERFELSGRLHLRQSD